MVGSCWLSIFALSLLYYSFYLIRQMNVENLVTSWMQNHLWPELSGVRFVT
jgi:hypothetical protein